MGEPYGGVMGMSIYGARSAAVAKAFFTLEGIPILLPGAALPLAWIEGPKALHPDGWSCITAAITAFGRGWRLWR